MADRIRRALLGCITPLLAAGALLVQSAAAEAATIAPGTPTNSIPAALFDPLGSLVPPLPADQFLLPVGITDASGLQNWGFDLLFDAGVVSPLDVGGLYQSVYQSEFNALDPTLSDIVASGVPLPGLLAGIAGFSWGASGDGTLAYVLFQFQPGQEGNDPGFVIDNPAIQQTPEPGTLVLLAAALLTASLLPRRRGASSAIETR